MLRIFAFLMFVTWSQFVSQAHAHGAMAIGTVSGTTPSSWNYAVVTNSNSPFEAKNKALQSCRAQGLSSCQITSVFQNVFIGVSFALYADHKIVFSETGITPELARSNVKELCPVDASQCTQPITFGDDFPPIVAKAANPAPIAAPPITAETKKPLNEQPNLSNLANGIIDTRNLLYLSAGILALLLMWLLWAVSIRTPLVVLQTYGSVVLWSGLPLLISFSLQARLVWGMFPNPLSPFLIAYLPAFVELYGIVYLMLYIANRLRVWGSPQGADRADHVFLRLPALAITIPVALALYFSQHQFKPDAELAICSLLAFAVLGIGSFIRPYQDAQTAPASATQPPLTEVTPQSAVNTAVAEPEIEPVSPNTLPAVISQSADVLAPMPPLEGIVLKLKRSQKTGTMGSLIYMLDARIDASQETLNLIARHNLGNRLIYESEARQKHAAAAQGHLAATRGGPSLLAPASEHATGAAKTIWNLGRAAVSAVRASLALRITVNSLLSGVHVECKDMEELLEAEAAIREAKENLEGFIETAKTFDGREEIH
jgi:hypothetical protein